ncbi:RpnC/YadD family protein [Beggiatoa alba]|uniref:hypothetical protein n=1 Tax=Beggiatoa alba TaxID=1022 RepID=UPI0002D6402F|nr:hypothetical protein [Beggiatoa alba]
MLDNAIQQIRQQERATGFEEGIFKGRAEGKTEALITLLEARFMPLTLEEKERLFQLTDEKITALLIQFYKIDSMREFWQGIETH